MKNSYSMTVGSTASEILPTTRKPDAPAWSQSVYDPGSYVTNKGRLYWTAEGGTDGGTGPVHKLGIVASTLCEWLLVSANRKVILSLHSGDEITISRNSVPTVDEGVIINAPYDMGQYLGSVQAIASADTIVSISCS